MSLAAEQGPRVCLCVILNHPFVDNIPLLRRIYQERFSAVRFLVPLARHPDPDVITVYRGSYCHAGFITDAYAQLAQIDCDYIIVSHDDVLINPRISEATFADHFPLGPGDGFHPRVIAQPHALGDWAWNFGFAPRLLHPKSILFGSGIELTDLIRFLPSGLELQAKLEAAGVPFQTSVRLSRDAMTDVARQPSRVLLHGLSAGIPDSHPEQAEIERQCLEIETTLVEVLLRAARASASMGAGPEPEGDSLALPFPVLTGGFFTDFYILPKSRLADFAHYVGVASAANLFVETMAPTILHAVCDRVWSAADLGLDLSGFPHADLAALADPAVFAIHPYKLSPLRAPEVQDGFLRALKRLSQRLPLEAPEVCPGRYSFGSDGPFEDFGVSGWHGREPWGRWSALAEAVVRFVVRAEAPAEGLRLRLLAPLHPAIEVMRCEILLNGAAQGDAVEVRAPAQLVEVSLSGPLIAGELNEVIIRSEIMVCPAQLPGGGDGRNLGFGLLDLEFV